MEELKEQAESLGIEVDGRWSKARLQAEIDKALEAPAVVPVEIAVVQAAVVDVVAEKPAQVTVTNLRDNPNKRLGLKGRGSVELTAEQMADEKFMARIMHGVESGVLGLG